jgi:hypothetical protein
MGRREDEGRDGTQGRSMREGRDGGKEDDGRDETEGGRIWAGMWKGQAAGHQAHARQIKNCK